MSRDQPGIHLALARRACLVVVLFGAPPGCSPKSTATHSLGTSAAQFKEPTGGRVGIEPAVAATSIEEVFVPEPSPSEPVAAVMTIRPVRASIGDSVEVLVSVRIASAHVIHAKDDAGGPYFPLDVTATLPEGVEPNGDWRFPTSEKWHGNSPVYRNSVSLRRSLKVVAGPEPRNLMVKGELRYQVCTEELCWPPGKLELSAPLIIEPR